MRVEAYPALHLLESDMACLPVLIGIGLAEQQIELIVADPTATL
jgi:hypothetical protein